jgi:hypothetical protein
MSDKTKLLFWELSCVLWICVAGSTLHFAFELSDFWTPMAIIAAVNESVWEHLKIYFWPGLLFTLVQYTYTRGIARNYWLGKVVALAVTPVLITAMYHSYMYWVVSSGATTSVGAILLIMLFGVLVGQLCSWRILCSEQFDPARIAPSRKTYVAAGYMGLVASFSLFTFFPPKVFLFENYLCYQYTGEYGILDDYAPYRIFRKPGEVDEGGNSIWYCNSGADSAMAQPTVRQTVAQAKPMN